MNAINYDAPKKGVKHGPEGFSRMAKKSHSIVKPMDDETLEKDYAKIMGRKLRFKAPRFKAAPSKIPVKNNKPVKAKSNPAEDDKDQEKLDLEFYRLSRFSQKGAPAKKAAKATKAAVAPSGEKASKYVDDIVSDLNISPEEDKLNQDY